MWIPEKFVDNDLFEMIRDEGGDQARCREALPPTHGAGAHGWLGMAKQW